MVRKPRFGQALLYRAGSIFPSWKDENKRFLILIPSRFFLLLPVVLWTPFLTILTTLRAVYRISTFKAVFLGKIMCLLIFHRLYLVFLFPLVSTGTVFPVLNQANTTNPAATVVENMLIVTPPINNIPE